MDWLAISESKNLLSTKHLSPVFKRESDFQSALISEARANGFDCYHTHDSRKSEEGFPDFVGIRIRDGDSVQLVAELKMPGKKPSDAQKKWLVLFAAVGAKTFLWYPDDWEFICKTLRS